jgi:integrase/recombinase XerD
MAELQPSKLAVRVRFPSPAPTLLNTVPTAINPRRKPLYLVCSSKPRPDEYCARTFRLVGRYTNVQTLRLSQAIDLFLRSILAGDNSVRTVETYRDMLAKFVEFMEDRGCHSLGDVQTPDIREWLIFKKQQGISSAHLYNCYRIPRRFWNWCMLEEYAEHDPFARVAKPKVEQQVKQALSDEQIKALLKACEGRHWLMRRDRALILLLLGTGLRIQECHQLRVCDVQGNSVFVQHGKGKKQRVVPLPPQASLAIHKYLAACPYRPKENDPLWWGNAGRITLDGLKQAVRAVGERA